MTSSNRFALLLPIVCCAALPLAAQRQLNPTVTVLREATGPVAPECYDQDATPLPRVDVAEMQQAVPREREADRQPPPGAALRGHLGAAQAALAAGDRTSFRAALAETRALLATYPSGAERDAAADVARMYEDVGRIWDYQFESPTGAFFEESSELYTTASAYPGYAEAVRRQVIQRGGARLYPSAETRAFLARAAADRAARLGVRTSGATQTSPRAASAVTGTRRNPSTASSPSRATSGAPRSSSTTTRASQQAASGSTRSTTSPASAPAVRSAAAASRTSSGSERSSRATVTPSMRTSGSRPAASAASSSSPSTTRSNAQPRSSASRDGSLASASPSAGSAGSMASVSTNTASSAPASSATPFVEPTDTASPLAATDTATSMTTTATSTIVPSTETTATVETAPAPTTSADEAATPAEGKKRGLLWPAVIVLVTVGVLILLFRASD